MRTITITGLDGTGKSTHAKWLQTILPNSTVVSVWDIISKKEFQTWSIYNKRPNVEQYVMNLSPTSRSLFIFHAFNEAYHRAIQSSVDYIIFDSHWYKYWAIELAMGAPYELEEFLNRQYEHSDITFCFELSIDEVLKRKKQLSHYECNNKDEIRIEDFMEIQKRAKNILKELLPQNTIFLDASQSESNIQKIIESQLIERNVV